jgi:hypothetical protein
MTGALLEATVAEALRHRKNPRLVIGVHSVTPPDRELILDLRIAWCRSMLEMREQLSGSEPGKVVVVSPLEEGELADDIRARLHRRTLLPVDVKEVLKQRYGARDIDARVRKDDVLCGALFRCAATPVIPGGVLYEEAAWQVICPEIFGIATARPDAADLLRWMAKDAEERLGAATPELRDRLAAWLKRTTGPIAETLLGAAAAGHARSAVALGLALRAVLSDPTRPELAQALVRIERFTGNRPLPRDTAETWAAAAEKVVQSGGASEAIESSDRILHELAAAQFAYLSRWSARGNEQLIEGFAAELSELPMNPARLESSVAKLKERYWPASDLPILGRLEMAVRLLRWLHTADPAAAGFEDAALWYAREGSWVDWARTRIRGGYERGPLASALARLSNAVKERRERFNNQFAAALAAWNNKGAHFSKLTGVESLLERYVAPLAAQEQPVLVIVLDGMSYAVCRELSAELVERRWSALSLDSLEIPPVVTALPSVTEFSRFSLIGGNLARGTQGAEELAWASHPALAAASGKQHPPVLFHKNDLAAMADPDSPVLREVANTKRRVVGIVINAIDDSLSGPVQIAPDWNLEYLAVLRPLLAEAGAAGRIVVLTSDHGHILDYGAEYRRHDGSDRYRPGRPELADEYYIEGGRAIGPSGFTALGLEGVRYGSKPRNGYHGGLTPQECLVPVVIMELGERPIAGWQPVVEATPEWWNGSQPTPAEAPRVKRKARQPSLFPEETDWVAGLLTNALFRQQMDLPGNRVKTELLAATLRALDSAGGRLLRPVFASRMNLALVRVGPVVAAMQRVLNYDGYGVLTIDEAADLVVLNRELLERQFSL